MDFLVRFASTTQDLDAAYALRRDVFEREQNVPRPLDRDAQDFNADHVVAIDRRGECVGTGRVVRVDARTCQVGRMATAATHRSRGIGGLVLDALERISALRGVAELTVHSQLPAEPFYAHRGYVREGPVFQDQGVPHVLMRKALVRAWVDPDAPSAAVNAPLATGVGRAPSEKPQAARSARPGKAAKGAARPAGGGPKPKRKAKAKAKVTRIAPARKAPARKSAPRRPAKSVRSR